MALVTVPATRAILTDPTSPGGPSVVCGTRRTSDARDYVDGAVDQYVGDTTQMRVFASTGYTMPIVFAALTLDQVTQLSAWKGRTLLLRTTEGGKWYGGFLELAVTAIIRAGVWDIAVTFTRLSLTDVV